MLSVSIFLAALGLIGLALTGLSFLVSSIREREAMATRFAALQSAAMLIPLLVFLLLLWAGFFETALGTIILIGGVAAGAMTGFLLLSRSDANPRALEGTAGLIVGEVKRCDEREIVFARNRYLQADSEQYREFYGEHPEWEEIDATRREKGGPLGAMGAIDKPHEGPSLDLSPEEATANHLSRYDCLLVPLAVDAGMGEMGRLGYLMTKEFGPRQRLSAVTTDLPLVPDEPVDIGVEHFCRICRKCAVCCPSRSIPEGEPQEVNGSLRWKLNEMTCFEYWGKVGTDCNVCMRVCPWSHARTFPHRMIVWMVARNGKARRLFSAMDDIFYGKRPRPKDPPVWAGYRR